MEEHRPKKLLDQVRACPELAEGMPSASNTIPIAPSKPTPAGSSVTFRVFHRNNDPTITV
jgi:hypothetical protein